MEWLKTLKDLECCPQLMKEEFKTEAIKWIIAIKGVQKKGDTLFKEHGKLKKDFEVDIYDYEQDDSAPMIKWIKYFFNITDKEIDDAVHAKEEKDE